MCRRWRDFAAAEDAVQEALIAATEQWPRGGIPERPLGWLIHVALRRLTDQVRRDSARRTRETNVAADQPASVEPQTTLDQGKSQDDTLLLLFMCCHPSLSRSSAIALTLRAVGGLTTAEIARAFLVPLPTMAQRIGRAKEQIRASHIPFCEPDAGDRAERIASVLHVLYLIFNEGYAASAGAELQRTDLAIEAIRLTRAVHRRLPDDAEVAGLLALMLLTDARRAARTGPAGELVPLDAQDRTLWNADAIAEGVGLVSSALRRGPVGEYQLLAAIAAVHDEAPHAAETDWPQIAALYATLRRISDNPLVTLNQAVAVAEIEGPQAGLALLSTLDSDRRVGDGHRLPAVRAHLLERAGDRAGAAACYAIAAERATNLPERNYLILRAARLREPEGGAAPD